LPTTAANADLLLNNVQVDFTTAIQIFGTTSAEVSRIVTCLVEIIKIIMVQPNLMKHGVSYTGVLNNIKLMNTIATQRT
jgi:hypothetical protein